MPRSLVGRLTGILALLFAAALASGFVMSSLFQQSTAAQIGQASAVASQSCGAITRAYRFYTAAWHGAAPDLADATLRRDLGAVIVTALNDKPGVEGGLWQADAGSLSYGFPTYEGNGPKTDVPQAELPRIKAAAGAALADDRPQLARFDGASQTLLIASCPLSGPIPGLAAWTMTRVHSFAASTYGQLMAGLAILSCAVVGASVLATQLALTWGRHVGRIEAVLAAAGRDHLPRLAPTGERELDRIVLAMNEAARRLARSHEETGTLSRQIAEAERLAAIGRVTAGVAHEIRNPIAAMRLKAESALRGDDRRKVQALHLVMAQVDRLDILVRRLLTVAERDPSRSVDVVLPAFLSACAAPHLDAAAQRLIRLTVATGLETARFDPDQMRRAIDGLLANALEAAPDGGDVALSAERRDDRLVVSVADSGEGPPEAIAATVFEPFVTGHPERAGLGLSIVRETARAHGGSAHFERRGETTLFLIEIPWLTS